MFFFPPRCLLHLRFSSASIQKKYKLELKRNSSACFYTTKYKLELKRDSSASIQQNINLN